MKLSADDLRLKTLDDGRLAQCSKPRVRVTNNGSNDDIVSRFDQSGMTMKAAAKALGTSIQTISYWRACGRSWNGRLVPTKPAKQGDLDNRMGNLTSPPGPPLACTCGSPLSFFHVGGPSVY